MTGKAEVRAGVLARRAALPADAHAAFAARLATLGPRIVLDYAPKNPALVVALFVAIGSEPDLMPFAQALQAAGVRTALPVTRGKDEPLVFRGWSPGDPLSIGRHGIAEPAGSAPALDPDMLFVPLAAFDRRGHRIGYGAGYYDRTLAGLRRRKTIRAVGVAFGVQEVLFIPSEDHDEPLDLVVTDREILICEA